jgi:thiamine-phosphate diphosphorylase
MNQLKELFPDTNFYFCFFTDRKKADIIQIISNLPAHNIVIFREYDLNYQERLKLAKEIQKICQKRNLKLIIGKNINLAEEISANGLHFSDHDDFLDDYHKIKNKFFTSCSFHSKELILKYQDLNFDIKFLSPIFPTTSHKNQKTLGIEYLKDITEKGNTRICPLGGINMQNITQLQNLNISGIAGIDLFKDIYIIRNNIS